MTFLSIYVHTRELGSFLYKLKDSYSHRRLTVYSTVFHRKEKTIASSNRTYVILEYEIKTVVYEKKNILVVNQSSYVASTYSFRLHNIYKLFILFGKIVIKKKFRVKSLHENTLFVPYLCKIV